MFGMPARDNYSPIEISEQKLFQLLKPRVGKKKAKAMAYDRNIHTPWKKQMLYECIGFSNNLVDIRLLYLFWGHLTLKQQTRLDNNKQKYVIVRNKKQ